MNPAAWLLGFFLPACGAAGANGVAIPGPVDLTAIARPSTPNFAIAAPAFVSPRPDFVTPVYPVSADRLYAAIRDVARRQPRTYPAAEYSDRMQATYVVRSAVFNFPDIVSVQVRSVDAADSTLTIFSRSVYGYSDLGVNRDRIAVWLTSVAVNLNSTQGR